MDEDDMDCICDISGEDACPIHYPIDDGGDEDDCMDCGVCDACVEQSRSYYEEMGKRKHEGNLTSGMPSKSTRSGSCEKRGGGVMAETIGGERPKRIQRKRSKGWKMPPNTVYVGRPTKWGNPHNISKYQSREACVDAYKRLVTSYPKYRMWMPELRGKNLACWCKEGSPCHADVLLEIANA